MNLADLFWLSTSPLGPFLLLTIVRGLVLQVRGGALLRRGTLGDVAAVLFALALAALAASMVTVFWDDLSVRSELTHTFGAHHWSLVIALGGILCLGLGIMASPLARLIWGVAPDLEEPHVPSSGEVAAGQLHAVELLGQDPLWRQGPVAVAEHLHRSWVEFGDLGGWDSAEPLWEAYQSELSLRQTAGSASDEFDARVRAAFDALLQAGAEPSNDEGTRP